MKIGYLFARESMITSLVFSSTWIMLYEKIREAGRVFFLSTFNLLHPFAYMARIGVKSSGFISRCT